MTVMPYFSLFVVVVCCLLNDSDTLFPIVCWLLNGSDALFLIVCCCCLLLTK